ncbi:hypothetical protein JRO89_XSUnG0066700 [Xanthoceras sorbifolium]|uniref:Germin-like protein n=1 Tax=Xanthoceras sorbifolium TaxID=99658 RepID=A0ABQ8GZP5_9ROSI|nr:hypothetical protein JRO89_XSUnG0066700 [Xanthoceras sorbifolium]
MLFFSLAILTISSLAFAYEPSPLQDFCVADSKPSARVNGLACKDPKMVEANDFFFSGLHMAAMVRLDFAPWGINPPHTHPRASEILTVLEGTLEVGFVTSNPENRLITKVLNKGDVFVFPVGLVHFQRNVGNCNAVAIAAFSSQNPGLMSVASAVFGSNPPISSDVLSKAFQVDKKIVEQLQWKF